MFYSFHSHLRHTGTRPLLFHDGLSLSVSVSVSVSVPFPLTPLSPPLLGTSLVNVLMARNARNDPHPHFGQTALQAAVESRQSECAKCILEAAAPR